MPKIGSPNLVLRLAGTSSNKPIPKVESFKTLATIVVFMAPLLVHTPLEYSSKRLALKIKFFLYIEFLKLYSLSII